MPQITFRPQEEWRDIQGYVGKYQISNTGRVRALDYHRSGVIKEMKPKNNKRGYLCVGLMKNAKKKFYQIHRLVAIAFLGEMRADYQVNHKNLNKTDNRVENLEWVTPQENTRHAIENGRFDRSAVELQRANKKRRQKIVSEKDGVRIEYSSIHEAYKILGVDRKQIKQSLVGRYPIAKGYRFFYA